MVKISVIIPVYNVSLYIERCIRSVINQTFTDIECIVVDDCSQDNSMDIMHGLLATYDGKIDFIILRHEVNRGLSAARNTGIESSKGEFLFFLDSDDELSLTALESFVAIADRYPGVDLIQGNILQDGKVVQRMSLNGMNLPEYVDNKQECGKILLAILPSVACNKLINRRFLVHNSLYFQEGIVHEDFYWTFFVAKSICRMAFCMDYTYYYYKNPGTITTSLSNDYIRRRYLSRRRIATGLIPHLSDGPVRKYEKIYIYLNLLSCNDELFKLKSIKESFSFWHFIIKIIIRYDLNGTYDLVILAHLLPPLCILSSLRPYKWRFIERIVTRIS